MKLAGRAGQTESTHSKIRGMSELQRAGTHSFVPIAGNALRENPGQTEVSQIFCSPFFPKTGRATFRWNIGKCPSVPVSSMGLLVANVELNKAVPSMVGTLATDFECTPDVMAILEIIPIFAPAKYLAPAGVAISCGLAFYSLSQELYPLERSTQCLHARWQRSMSWAHL